MLLLLSIFHVTFSKLGALNELLFYTALWSRQAEMKGARKELLTHPYSENPSAIKKKANVGTLPKSQELSWEVNLLSSTMLQSCSWSYQWAKSEWRLGSR